MIILRQKSFVQAAKVISNESIGKEIARQVGISTKYIKEHPMDPGLLRRKVAKVSIF